MKTARPRARAVADHTARERLLAAAATLFARKGYAATSVSEIVAAAAVTRPVLYYWFSSKEGVFLHLMTAAIGRFDAVLSEVRSAGGAAPVRLHAVCRRIVDLVQENLEIARLVYAISYGPPQGAPAFDVDAVHNRVRAAVREEIETGLAQGTLRGDVEDIQWAVIGAMSICIEISLSHPELTPDVRALFDRLFAVLMRGIAPPGRKERKHR